MKILIFRNFLLIFMVFLFINCDKNIISLPVDDTTSLFRDENIIDRAKAEMIASRFINLNKCRFKTKSDPIIVSVETVMDDVNNMRLMYIINYYNGGFVIVGASKNYYPILAYSDGGSFNLRSNAYDNFLWLSETKNALLASKTYHDSVKLKMNNLWKHYMANDINSTRTINTKGNGTDLENAFQNRIQELDELGGEYSYHRLSDVFETGDFPDTYGAYQHYCNMANEAGSPLEYTIVAMKGGQTTEEVGPLLTTQWKQSYPFNLLCVNYPESAGCGTIAIAQIMKFHKFPSTYDWENMANLTANIASQILVRDINRRIGSGSTNSEEKAAFEYFGYNASIREHDENSVKNELLTYGRPVLMGGWTEKFLIFPAGDGHSWVCDGVNNTYYYMTYFIDFYIRGQYSSIEFAPSIENPNNVTGGPSLYFHMNWGWGPNSSTPNAWFVSNNVSTSAGNYQYQRKNIYVSN